MSTSSAPTRFWGVVAIVLNSVLQSAGEICGGTDSPALRLSPSFQIANAISLIYHSVRLSFAIGSPYRIALGVVVERAELYYNPSDTKGPERHILFRVFVFIFGALPTVIKALAIQGDRVSRWLVLSFFVPFLVLEFIEQLAEPPTLARLAEVNKIPAEKRLSVTPFRQMAAIFALVFHVNLCLETVNLALMKSIFEAKPFEMNYLFSMLVATVGPVSLKIYGSAPKDKPPQLVMLTLGLGCVIFFNTAFQDIIRMWGCWSEIATTILAIAVVATGTLAHLFIYLRLISTTLRQLFSGGNRHKQKFLEQWVALWTVGCIILYYGYLYDASGTYKLAWTEWLP